MKRNVMMIIYLIGMAVSIQAQTLSGKLVDEKNVPLAYANVVLLQADSTFVSGTISDEMGNFRLVKDEKGTLVRISSIGYATIYRKVNGGDFGVIQMASDAQLLGEVTVKGNLPVTRVKGDALVTSVAGTLLEKAGTAEDLLDKIPNVTAENGNVEVFGRGTPEIYINGRKVRDNTELDRLESDNIKSVEVINNPGARYDASVTSVIRINTKKAAGEGFGFNNRTYGRYNGKWSGLEQLGFNYRAGKLDVEATVTASEYRSWLEITQTTRAYLDDKWEQVNVATQDSKSQDINGQLSLNYTFNSRHAIGARYGISCSPEYEYPGEGTFELFRNGELVEESTSTSITEGEDTKHDVNLYYQGKLKDWHINMNLDGVWFDMKQHGHENESYQQAGDETKHTIVTTDYLSDSRLYAGKLVVSRPLAGGELTLGSEYTYTKRTNLYTNPQGLIDNDDSHVTENNLSAFAEYERQIGKMTIAGGIRYEKTAFDYYEKDVYRKDMSRSYEKFYPSLGINFPLGKAKIAINYAKDIQRPHYEYLSSNIRYVNRYTYQSGNPQLLPTITNSLSLNAVYRWLQLQVGYEHIENAILQLSIPYSSDVEDFPILALTSQFNHPSYKKGYASLTLSPTIGIWHPQLSAQLTKQWMTLDTPFGAKDVNTPQGNLVWRNAFNLPSGFVLNANAYFRTKGNRMKYSYYKNTWKMDFTLSKSFLKNQLSVQLNAKNPFRTWYTNDFDAYQGSVQTFHQKHNASYYEYTLNIRYKFNQAKSKYKGTGAGQSQKARM